jgi:MFS family permease
MALIRQAFPDARARGRAVGVWAMGGAVASSSGPVLGGVLNLVDWRLIFFINVPAGTGGAWYQHATQHPASSIRSGDHHAGVTFAPAGQTQREATGAACRAKYARYGVTCLPAMLAGQAVDATLRVAPQP